MAAAGISYTPFQRFFLDYIADRYWLSLFRLLYRPGIHAFRRLTHFERRATGETHADDIHFFDDADTAADDITLVKLGFQPRHAEPTLTFGSAMLLWPGARMSMPIDRASFRDAP